MNNQDNNAIHTRLDTATQIIREAGALGLSYFRQLATLDIETKSNGQDVVSIADQKVEKLLRERVSAAYPDDDFLGEEYGLNEGSSGFTWVVDPIDGTSCFIHGQRSWCVAIALVHAARTVAGLIYDPNADELFSAIEGEGARLNGEPISVDLHTDLEHGLTSIGANYRVEPHLISGFIHELLQTGGMFVRSGSGALSLAHVACGRLAAYYEPHMNAWDCIAAQCIIREAGGWTNDFFAEGSLTDGAPVIGCAPQLREPILALISKVAGATS